MWAFEVVRGGWRVGRGAGSQVQFGHTHTLELYDNNLAPMQREGVCISAGGWLYSMCCRCVDQQQSHAHPHRAPVKQNITQTTNRPNHHSNVTYSTDLLHGTNNMSPLTKDTEEKQFHMSEILGNFPSIKTRFFSSRAIKVPLIFSVLRNRKWVTWPERAPCFRFRSALAHSALQTEKYDSC